MERKLKLHDKHMRAMLKDLEAGGASVSSSRVDRVTAYHQAVVRDLQHERLIHLIVTLFFALLFVASTVGFVLVSGSGIITLVYGMGALVVLLLITEIAYVRHYYLLENGVQRLYDYTDRLHELRS